MTDYISPQQFHEAEGVADWRLTSKGATAYFRTRSFAESARFVQAISELPEVEDHHPGVDVRHDGVTIHVITYTDDYFGPSSRDVELARQISAVASKLGLTADPSAVQSLLIIPGATDIAKVKPFWQAVLGYEPRRDSPDEDLVDPHDRGALFWFEQMNEPRGDGGGAIHVAVWVPHEEAETRIAAALAAGGRMVRDEFAPSWWTLADAAGNKVAASFPRAGWIVPGLLPTGLSTLAGRPKMGKSWLALQVACAVGTGGCVLDRAVEQGPVLYIALEDGPRRLQERLRRQGASQADVTFALQWQPLGSGGLEALRTAVDEQKYKLVIVDTLTRVLGRAEQFDLAAMARTIGALQNVTRTTGAAILTVDHHKKPIGSLANPIDDIVGSTGKAALVDAALGLYRERGRHDATLRAVGRDMEEIELYIRWDGEHCCWQAVGEAGEVRKQSLRAAILDAIRELNELGEVSSTTAIARHLGKEKSNVSHELADLMQAGKVVKGQRDGRVVPYFLAGQAPPHP